MNSKSPSEMGIQACFQLAYSGFKLDLDVVLPGRGVTVLFGHSGSGKTTLLRCIAGLERATGSLSINGESWQDEGFFLPTYQRPLGYVFQEANLFEHLTVLKNLNYGLKRVAKQRARPDLQNNLAKSLDQVIELLGIASLLDRKPDRLSGGERQRVAIARALALNPRVLLMDEPLASLDLERKQEILPFLERLHDALEIPILYVTHSVDELARLADHLLLLEQGKAVACGPLTETLARLDLPIRLADELGVVLKAEITERDLDWSLARATFEGGSLWVRDMDFEVGQAVRLRILARDVSLTLEEPRKTSILNAFSVTIEALSAGKHPAVQAVQVRLGANSLLAHLTARSVHALGLKTGQTVWAQIKSVAIID